MRGRVPALPTLLISLSLSLSLLPLMGCGGGVIQRVDALPPAAPGTGFVEIQCEPKDADLYIDGKYRGRLDGYAHGVIRVPEGARRIKIAKAGFYPQYAYVQAGPEAVRFKTHLVPSIDAPVTTRLSR